jgi:hypothetical protein
MKMKPTQAKVQKEVMNLVMKADRITKKADISLVSESGNIGGSHT